MLKCRDQYNQINTNKKGLKKKLLNVIHKYCISVHDMSSRNSRQYKM